MSFLTGCGGQPSNSSTSKNNGNTNVQTNGETATAKAAFDTLKSSIDEVLAGKSSPRLGQVVGSGVDSSGKAKSWMFMYYVDRSDGKYSDVYTFRLNKGKIEKYSEELMSVGLDTPDFDYVRNDIGNDWKDSPEVAKAVYASGNETNKNGIRMSGKWNKEKLNDGPIWEVDTMTYEPQHVSLYNMKTGAKI